MRKLQISLFIFIFGFLFCIPYNTNALAKEVVSCDYQFTNENGKKIELNYQIFSDGSVGLSFGDGSLFSNDGFICNGSIASYSIAYAYLVIIAFSNPFKL